MIALACRVLSRSLMESSSPNRRYERIDEQPGRIDAPFDSVDARLAALHQLLVSVEKAQKIVLTEVRGLANKVDRLTRARGRGHPNP